MTGFSGWIAAGRRRRRVGRLVGLMALLILLGFRQVDVAVAGLRGPAAGPGGVWGLYGDAQGRYTVTLLGRQAELTALLPLGRFELERERVALGGRQGNPRELTTAPTLVGPDQLRQWGEWLRGLRQKLPAP